MRRLRLRLRLSDVLRDVVSCDLEELQRIGFSLTFVSTFSCKVLGGTWFISGVDGVSIVVVSS